MATDQQRMIELDASVLLGLNTAQAPTKLVTGQWRSLKNGYQDLLGDLTQRPGTIPVTGTALGASAGHLMKYPFINSVAVGAAPTLSAVAGAFTLPSDTYYVRYTYVTDHGETEASAEASQAIVLGESLRIVVPAIPFHANSINIYISTSTNTETLEVTETTSLSTDIEEPLTGGGAAYPTTNTTEFDEEILASSGTSLYAYYNNAWTAPTMTDALNQADIFDVNFTATLTSVDVRKIIADQGDLKSYDGDTVADITPAADDTSPAPANNLTTLNALGPRFIWSYQSHVFMAFAQSYAVWYSKRFTYDYFPTSQNLEWNRNNDYVNGCGVAFDNSCLIPMRNGWGVLLGSTFDDFEGNLFLNTTAGVIAPRSIQRVTYPDGSQTIIYLSDDSVHEIYDTGFEGTGSRRYSTRSIMQDRIDFNRIELTDEEKTGAVSFFDSDLSLYLLKFNKGAERIVYAYDVRTRQWYPWENIGANGFVNVDQVLYFAGDTGHLHKFDEELSDDWDDSAQATGTPVDFDVYTGLIEFEYTGFQSYLDYLIINAKQFSTASSLDVQIITFSSTTEYDEAVENQYMVWGSGEWGEAVWYNVNFTDLVGRPTRLVIKKKSYFYQIRFRNPRSELVKLYGYKMIGRTSK